MWWSFPFTAFKAGVSIEFHFPSVRLFHRLQFVNGKQSSGRKGKWQLLKTNKNKEFSPAVGVKTAGAEKSFLWLRGVNNKCVTLNYTPLNFTNRTLWVGTQLLSRAVWQPRPLDDFFSRRLARGTCQVFKPKSGRFSCCPSVRPLQFSGNGIGARHRCLSGADDERREMWLTAVPQKCSHFATGILTASYVPSEIRCGSFAPEWKWEEINQAASRAAESDCC